MTTSTVWWVAAVASLTGGVPSMVVALIASRTASQANSVAEEANRIDLGKAAAEVYARNQQFYEKAFAEADKHLDRMRARLEGALEELDAERANSGILRGQVRTLTTQLESIESTLGRLHREAHHAERPPVPPPMPATP